MSKNLAKFEQILRDVGCPEGWVPFDKYGDGRIIRSTFSHEGLVKAACAVYVRPRGASSNFTGAIRLIIPGHAMESIRDFAA